MARILLGSWMVRYPLGGNLSWALQWLVGLHRLGHDVWLVERSGYPNACYDPVWNAMTDDCAYGTRVVSSLLAGHGLEGRWCYRDEAGAYHGLAREAVERLFASADLYIDMGAHGAWREEARASRRRVLVEAEPGFTQMRMELRLAAGELLDEYDAYYSIGLNVGTGASSAPTAGRPWHGVLNPVVPELFDVLPAPADAPYTTVMNWRAHAPIEYGGRIYGQKDVEFERFLALPRHTDARLEVAVAGSEVPGERLREHGWRLRDAHRVSFTVDAYRRYIAGSRGEFGVCKEVFVATRSGWFSDRSAAYLASGRPVVLQDTGFGDHLPCGEGLFAVGDVDEAADALAAIEADYERHARAARELALEHLDARVVLGRMLEELGVG
jgi:hypothetical protein